MAKILLVTGGCRSGKSMYAQNEAENTQGNKIYLATSPVLDDEMRSRISKHQESRDNSIWQTIEEEIEIAEVINNTPDGSVILLDCVTLWINNILYRNENVMEEDIATIWNEILISIKDKNIDLVIVTNEVGLGVVPDNSLSRLYRDLVGRSNQVIASYADKVVLVSCGIPLVLKG